jgi:hypothetical protein
MVGEEDDQTEVQGNTGNMCVWNQFMKAKKWCTYLQLDFESTRKWSQPPEDKSQLL